MKILFLSLIDFNSVYEKGIYQDLLREFIKHNNSVYIISPVERRLKKSTKLIIDKNVIILKLKIGNIQKTNVFEKGISTIMLEGRFESGIRKYFSDVKFDLILYSTPPITFQKAVQYAKRRDGAKTYLLLKDIFPQNAVDMGMLSKSGLKGILYKYFRLKEKRLYAVSDYIGCMSKANMDYIIEHNPEIDKKRVEVCPNSVEICDMRLSRNERNSMRRKYNIPIDKKVFVYGGNLGKPQGIPFLIDCLKACIDEQEIYFLIVGDGTEYRKLEEFFKKKKPSNMKLMKRLPKEDYDKMVAACDIGMIFLDHKFTIPNFPSRLLSYMQAGIPVIACTDTNTDIGEVITEGGFGWWCESNDTRVFQEIIKEIMTIKSAEFEDMKNIEWKHLIDMYDTYKCYKLIISHTL